MLRLIATPFRWIGNHLAARLVALLVIGASPLMVVQDFFEGQRMDKDYWSSVLEVLGNCLDLILVGRTL